MAGGRTYRAAARPAAIVLGAALAVLPCAILPLRAQAPADEGALAQAARSEAAAPKALGTFDSWISVELGSGAAKACYMFARPAASEPKGAKRGDIMVVVTHRPGAKRQDEVSFQAGYPFKDGSAVAVDVDGKKFEFFTRLDVDQEAAWARDPEADKAIVAAMRAGKSLKVRATSARNTETTDTFSLAGFTKAYAEIGKACGVK